MMLSTMTVELPEKTYVQLQQVAYQQNRSIPDVVQNLLTQDISRLPRLPDDLETELAVFTRLSNHVLWLLARSILTIEERTELANLNYKAQRVEGLTDDEKMRQTTLLNLYNRTLVHRSEAANLLRKRGEDISSLFEIPSL